MTNLASVVPVSRRVLDSAAIFGTLSATAIAIVIMTGLVTVAIAVALSVPTGRRPGWRHGHEPDDEQILGRGAGGR